MKKQGKGPSTTMGKAAGIIVLACALLIPYLYSLAFPRVFYGIESRIRDGLFALRYAAKGPERRSPFIINVVFDNDSLKVTTKGTSERLFYAKLIRAVSESGARLIACDVVFAEGGGDEEALTSAVRDAGNVFLPVVPYAEGVLSSFDGLMEAAAGSGHIACDPDPDGVNRHFPLSYRYKDSTVPSLPLRVACEYLSVQPENVESGRHREMLLKGAIFAGGRIEDVRVPLDDSGRIVINYPAPRKDAFYTISARDLVSSYEGGGDLKLGLRDVLENSIVFISDASAKNKDIGPGVFGEIIPYSEVLLSVANSLLTDRFIVTMPPLFLPFLLLALFVILSFAHAYSGSSFRLFAPICLILFYILVSSSLFIAFRLFLPMGIPILCVFLWFAYALFEGNMRNGSMAKRYKRELEQARKSLEFAHAEGRTMIGLAEASTVRGGEPRADPPTTEILAAYDEDRSVNSLRNRLKSPEAFDGIVTRNQTMIGIFHEIEAYRSSDTPILIIGETGTGKELIAHAIHRASGRKGKYVAVNVAGINEELFNDTLFGHKRGAYTGAERDEIGFVEVAEGGTLFLDEIGDLSGASQVKLLRLIENKEYYPLNSKALMKADVRIIAATNADIEGKPANSAFRDDLARRLGLRISVPPLRERPDDIVPLLEHFMRKSAGKAGKPVPGYSRELIDLLESYRFPGNIRELESMVEEAISKNDLRILPATIFRARMARESRGNGAVVTDRSGKGKAFPFAGDLPQLLTEIESHYVKEAMDVSKGNRRKAAKLLGVNYDWLKRRAKG